MTAGPGQVAARRVWSRRRLAITLSLSATYMIAEAVGGWLANSLALLADAGHMLSDVAALSLTLFALWVSQRPPTRRHTYGFYRAEILAALFNGAALVAISLFILVEAWRRMRQPPAVQSGLLMLVAGGGLLLNLVSLLILLPSRREGLNLRGAWLHVLSDCLGSAGAVAAGVIIWRTAWTWVDPLISVGIALLIVNSSRRLLVESVSVLLEGVPGGLDIDRVQAALEAVPGVDAVHDLHIWSLTSDIPSLSAHVVTRERPYSFVLTRVRDLLREQFGIHHVTIQIEPPAYEDRQGPP